LGENIKKRGKSPITGIMARISKVDDRGRIKLSKEIARPGTSVVIIDARTYFLGIPVESDRVKDSGSWMKTKLKLRDLSSIAEAEASQDAVTRAKNRKHL
jgi:hypothetical protein